MLTTKVGMSKSTFVFCIIIWIQVADLPPMRVRVTACTPFDPQNPPTPNSTTMRAGSSQ